MNDNGIEVSCNYRIIPNKLGLIFRTSVVKRGNFTQKEQLQAYFSCCEALILAWERGCSFE